MEGWIERGVAGTAAAVVLALVLAAVGALAAGVSAASGEALSPWWHVSSGSRPSYLAPEGKGEIVATLENVGDASTIAENEGKPTPVQITDTLPAGLRAVGAAGGIPNGNVDTPIPCSVVTGSLVACEDTDSLTVFGFIEVRIVVAVEPAARTDELNMVSVSGGGAPATSIERPITVSNVATPFGVEGYELVSEEAGGSVDEQAGSHPFQLTLAVTLDETADTTSLSERPRVNPVALARDLHFRWPPGLIGTPTGVPSCPLGRFQQATGEENMCPANTAVGVARISALEPSVGVVNETVPLFNVEAEKGEPARFGFTVSGNSVLIDVSVRSGEDYGLTLKIDNITQNAALLATSVTIWGTPGDPSHDSVRGYGCLFAALEKGPEGACDNTPEAHPQALLSLPVACTGAIKSDAEGDSWQQANEQEAEGLTPRLELLTSTIVPALDGCASVPFAPEIDVAPDVSDASAPSGLDVDVHVGQEGSEGPAGGASSSIRDITIALPDGVALNPAGANGLTACSESQVGFTGFQALHPESEPGALTPTFTPGLPEALEAGSGSCPSAAKIGTVKLRTPILANPLRGAMYLAAQNANPFSSFLAIYVLADDPVSGTLVKLPGVLSLSPASGQITATFEGTPQIPLEEIELDFFGGEHALLATPAHCGTYATQASFVPWSAVPGQPSHTVSSTFQITSGANGAPRGSVCPSQGLPFSPSLTGGSTNIEAGAFSPLTTTLSREDGQQAIRAFQLRLSPGLTGLLSTVKLCPEQRANEGSCSAESQIGETTVSAGVGGDPYQLTGGKVYLTGPYSEMGSCTPGQPSVGTPSSSSCAPFGLSIVTPVKAGPLDLENTSENHPGCDCLVIRAKIEVDPQTAQLTIATGEGVGGIPTILDGIPLQIKKLNITIDRQGFIFNPTDCARMSLDGTIAGGEGASAPVSSPFRVANCANLKFAPKLTASTGAHAEALKGGHGASLNVEIASRGGAGVSGEEANVKRVDLTLPELLPARLQPTLQNACTGARFANDPASCPPDSFVGTATAVTPLLDVPLRGPAIFVSRGGAALPDLDLVLQGEGVEILLTGHTDVKGEVTYSRFETFPDTPISSFALSLPDGPHSALASGLPTNERSLCGQSLEMPTTIEGQNGVVRKQDTRVRIEGCKPALYIRSTRVSGTSVTITVTVPSAGKIVASGDGLSSQTKHPGGEKLVTLKLTLSRAQAAKLAKTHSLKAKVELVFTPKRGRRLAKGVAVRFA
jgi:hypothetical protein